MSKILFISHELSLSGAPKVLYEFLLKFVPEQKKHKSTVLSLSGGSMTSKFLNNFNTYVNDKGITRLSFYFFVFIKSIYTKHDLVFINSISCFQKYSKIKKLIYRSKKCILYVHESELLIKLLLPDFKKYIHHVDFFICVSENVKTVLINHYSIPDFKISVIPPVISNQDFSVYENKTHNAFTVCASGTAHFIKGYDVFLQIARVVKEKLNAVDCKFIWVGKISPEIKVFIDFEVLKMGLSEIVTYWGHYENPFEAYKTIDIGLITSREESYSLYAYEIGMMGKPVLCFNNAGGVSDLVKYGGGTPVEYMNIEKMADLIISYYNDRKKIASDGGVFKERFLKIDSNENYLGVLNIINSFI